MAITVDAETQNSATGTSVSVSHTVGAGSNTILYALACSSANASGVITGVNYGAAGMTLVSSADGGRIAVYRLLSPSAGSASLAASLDTSNDVVLFGVSLFGVDQVTPDSGATFAYDSSGVTITSATGSLVLDIAGDASGRTSWTVTGAQTVSSSLTISTFSAAYGRAPGAASTAMTWSGSPGANLPRNLAFSVSAASGGGSATPGMIIRVNRTRAS